MLLDASKASLLLIDIQERLLPAMAQSEQVVAKSNILMQAANSLGLPVTISEQYPKGLGHTVAALQSHDAATFKKLTFSCWRDAAMKNHFINLHEKGRPLVVVAGIEAHICVLQTCIDMAQAGFGVFAVADAMWSHEIRNAALIVREDKSGGLTVEKARRTA
jgi:nicotinamidase-related amidase